MNRRRNNGGCENILAFFKNTMRKQHCVSQTHQKFFVSSYSLLNHRERVPPDHQLIQLIDGSVGLHEE